MRIVIVTPHFAPDVAPTGEVITRVTEELGRRGHVLEVVTSLPWYRRHRVEPGFAGHLVRHEDTPWGRITRIHPFAGRDKRNIFMRAAAYSGFSLLGALLGMRGERVDGVLGVSPPLTLGLTSWATAARRSGPFVFNIQDVYPDVAVELEVITDARLIKAARRLERFSYERADAITVLSQELGDNVASKIRDPSKVRVIPNFVDTAWIRPEERYNDYRREHALQGKYVVMYAGNIGLSQSLELFLDAAGALAYEHDIMFVINGEGAARPDLERRARGLHNVRFIDMQPSERLPELLAAADLHIVPLKRGLARASVPSKTYSILAAGRPLIASVDEGSEVARIVETSGAGLAVPPEDPEAFTKAVHRMSQSPEDGRRMGEAGRAFVETWASPGAVAGAYESLFEELGGASART